MLSIGVLPRRAVHHPVLTTWHSEVKVLLCSMPNMMSFIPTGVQGAAIGSIVFETDVVLAFTGNFNNITLDHMKINNFMPQVDHFDFPNGRIQGRPLNQGCATGHPSFVMSRSRTRYLTDSHADMGSVLTKHLVANFGEAMKDLALRTCMSATYTRVLRDGLCHDVEMRLVHHTADLLRSPDIWIPTLPTERHVHEGHPNDSPVLKRVRGAHGLSIFPLATCASFGRVHLIADPVLNRCAASIMLLQRQLFESRDVHSFE